jgi:hypothetical protein
MRFPRILFFAAMGCLVGGWIIVAHVRRVARSTVISPVAQAIPQDIYVWQRDWTPAVPQAVADKRFGVRRFVVLAAEISLRQKTPKLTEIHPDYPALAPSVHEIGLAIRIGPLRGSRAGAMDADSVETKFISTSAQAAIAAPRKAGLVVAEVQIDFDCAESKLAGYSNWVNAVENAVAPVPVVITALPSWLHDPQFASVARQASSFVLQVHSLHQPAGPDAPMTLCDPDEARRAVLDAAKIGVPFRVALPTYSYLAGFSPEGKLLGLSAEGPEPAWPAGTTLRLMRSDPSPLADLVRQWAANPPPGMTGIIWYRLPVRGDTMNWYAPTLLAVMAGHTPTADLRAVVTRSAPGLFDISLYNAGDDDAPCKCQIEATWDSADLIAAESLDNFSRLDSPPNTVIFRANDARLERWIAPGQRLQIGWIRLSADKEVQTHVAPLSPLSR